MAVVIQAEVKPRPFVFRLRFAANPLDVLIAACRAAHDAIRPAHLLDVLKALFFRREEYVDIADTDCFRVLPLSHVFILHK